MTQSISSHSAAARRCCMLLLIAAAATACTKRNPDLCCATDTECAAIGFSSRAPCDLGVCVKNECTTGGAACDDDTDCPSDAPACVAGSCAVCATNATCPTSAPVCDAAAHDCRLCVRDGECDSLACDLTVGTCIDPAQIRYASPVADETQPCSRTRPCALGRASQTADAQHPYIALLPGIHDSGADFDGKAVTVCGNDATYDANGGSSFVIRNGSTVTFRDLKVLQTDANDDNDSTIFNINKSSLTLSNVQMEVAARSFNGINQFTGISLTIERSSFKGTSINLTHTAVFIDQSSFLDNTTLDISDDGIPTNITNSIFDMPSHGLLRFQGSSPEFNGNSIHGNTFFGGTVECNEDGTFRTYFNANIFFNTTLTSDAGSLSCLFDRNIMSPGVTVSGTGNVTADPMFVSIDKHDFHLQAGSPAIDPATDPEPDVAHTSHDFDGTPRPQGTRNDIGAFEYVLPSTP